MLGIDMAAAGIVIAALTFGSNSLHRATKEARDAGIKSASLEAEIKLLKSDLMAKVDLLVYRVGQLESAVSERNCRE